jgi:hypothetical protein
MIGTPDSSTSAVWLRQRHLAAKKGDGKKICSILLASYLNHAMQGSLTCCKILWHGTFGFTSHPKEDVLWICAPFVSSGKHTNHFTTEETNLSVK